MPTNYVRWGNQRRENNGLVHNLVLSSIAKVLKRARQRGADARFAKKATTKAKRAKQYNAWINKDGNKSKRAEKRRTPEGKAIEKKTRGKRENKDRELVRLKKRRETDPEYLMTIRLRNRFYCAFKRRKKIAKDASVIAICGLSKPELSKWLHDQMTDDMTMFNTDIDHIIPLAKYNLQDAEDRRRAWHYTNLRPCWPSVNRRKSANWPDAELLKRVDPSCWPASGGPPTHT